MDLKIGDPVRLTQTYADAVMGPRVTINNHGKLVDWRKRKGKLVGISFNRKNAYVKWHGRMSYDHLPLQAIERIESKKRRP